jgi:NADPH:quinone reductase-like Zn-dependent oxidoreductase
MSIPPILPGGGHRPDPDHDLEARRVGEVKAALRTEFGTPDVIRIEEVANPELVDEGLLVRVGATSVNPAEWYEVHGRPTIARFSTGLRRPKSPRLGVDFAGVVEAIGSAVDDFAVGDRVFGGRTGSWAEYLVVQNAVARIPDNVSFEEAAGTPIAALTALQALRDHAAVKPGDKVLVNGASGGVGTYVVQLAKRLGAEVTAVCSTPNVETARFLGADRVIDYHKADFTAGGDPHDIVIDIAGSRGWSDLRRVLTRDGLVVVVGGPKGSRLLGPLSHVIRTQVGALFSPQKSKFFIQKFVRSDVEHIARLMEAGTLKTVIDSRFEGLEQLPDALRHFGEGHARGKVVVSI